MSAAGSPSASMKYRGKTVSNRCDPESVAVMIIRRGQPLEERETRGRRVHDDETARQRLEHGRPLRCRQVRPDEVELRLDAVERPVPQKHEQQHVVAAHPRAQPIDGLSHVRRGRRMLGVATLEQRLDVRRVERQLFPQDPDQRSTPLAELPLVLGLTRGAGDDERVSVRRGGRGGSDEKQR
jgi:hypothetical protein